MAGVGNRAQTAGGALGSTTTLFLVVDDPVAADAAGLGEILERLGFLADGARGEQLHLPVDVTLASAAPVTLDAGPHVAAALDTLLVHAPATTIGLAGIPSRAGRTVIAMTVDGDATADRAACAHNIAFIASSIAAMTNGVAIFWPPARLWSASEDLAGAVIAMQANALPPVLHFVAFSMQEQPEQRVVSTQGLDWFVGHELVIRAAAEQFDMTQLMRRAGRLSIDAMVNGPFAGDTVVAGLEPGELISLSRLTTPDGSLVVEAHVQCRSGDGPLG